MARRIILVTGSTGVVGSALVPVLLEQGDTELRLLIRARDEVHLRERLQGLLNFWTPDPAARAEISRHVRPLRGDVTADQLGLGTEEHATLAGELTHIIHSAANVKMNMAMDEARRISVKSAQEITALAAACQGNGQFQKLDVVSTIGVAGKMAGIVPEEPLTAEREFHNTYESSKAEAETLILNKIQEGLPVTIHRPSMVVGDSTTGKIQSFQIFYHLCTFLSGTHTGGLFPTLSGVRLDTVPVDYVARAIASASEDTAAAGRILHLCSGPDLALDVESLRQQVYKSFTEAGRKLPGSKQLPHGLFRAAVTTLRSFSNQRSKRTLGALLLLLDYLKEARQQSFATARTAEFFAGKGISVPPPGAYLSPVLDYYLSEQADHSQRKDS